MTTFKFVVSVLVIMHLASSSFASQSLETVVDKETGLSFQYPSLAPIQQEVDNGWSIPTTGVSPSSKLIQWNIFSTDDPKKNTLKERCSQFASNQAASDGAEGGTHAVGNYLTTVKSKSGDEVLIFELEIYGYGNAENVNDRPAGFILAVDLKPTDTKTNRHLIIHSASKATLIKIAKTISVPKNISLK